MNQAPSTKILGAVLAGGQSRRFGSDKALAVLEGTTLLERAVAGLAALCGDVVVIGRGEAPVMTVPDRPAPGLGPLGGIAGALHYAGEQGYDAVLVYPVDGGSCGPDLLAALDPGPAYCESQPVIGLWPVSTLVAVEGILAGNGSHSLRAFAAATGARAVALALPPANINTPADLAALETSDAR